MRLLPALAVAAGLAGCGASDDALVTYQLPVMATLFEVSLPRHDGPPDPNLLPAIETRLRAIERDFYAWGDGELAALNAALSAGERFEASEAMAALLVDAQAISAASDRAFDPGVGALVELWGFHVTEKPEVAPEPDRIEATRTASGSIGEIVIADAIDVAASASGRRFLLDLGGIAKGYAVDEVVAILEAAGVAPAVVNAGGDLRTLGSRPDRRWQIGIASPRGDELLGTLALDAGEAAFTSGDYERYFDDDTGTRQHHILDPRNGRPATHTRAVTVIADNGTLADAAATALLVAGPTRWRSVAAALDLAMVLRVDASGAIEMTTAMRDRFQPSETSGSDIIIAAD